MAYIPKPFKRPGVEIGTRSSRRWADVRALSLSVGDVVQNRGVVVSVDPRMVSVEVDFLSGEYAYYQHDDVVRAFTEGVSVGDSK